MKELSARAEVSMISPILLYLGAFLTLAWGLSHLFPTRNVVKGFGNISQDNRHIITMEWNVEGVYLIFVGLFVAAATLVDRAGTLSRAVYWIAFAELNVLSLVSLFTGFRVNLLPFKLCPVIFTASSVPILAGSLL
jgi:hypothetical protein